MKPLPLLLSVPHAGLTVPVGLSRHNALSAEEIAADGDEGAREIYLPLARLVGALVTTHIARAFLDMNRAPDDVRKDGVVKTHTCWDVPIYSSPVPEMLFQRLIEHDHRHYHEQLTELGSSGRFIMAVDCHTMAAVGPPVGPDVGQRRPLVCLSNGDGRTCSDRDFERLSDCFRDAFGEEDVALNEPFKGGYIVRQHSAEMSWVQLELSRGPVFDHEEKRARVLSALAAFCALDGRRGSAA